VTYVYDCDHRHDGLAFPEVKRLVGGKAANLTVMAVDLGLPVPPAFTITTAACNEYLAHGWPEGLDDEIRAHMVRMEALVGQRFGDPADPLLVSVRSGAPVSMPGMMETILNLGLNDATTAGLAASSGSDKFAANCRRRFETMFRDIVGVEEVPADQWMQLRAAIEAVFRSWTGDKARTFRQVEGIPDDLGTAVTVQAMVFGNRSVDSGTGVMFTRDPATGEPTPYGDVMFNAQGEDVVAGTHRTEPIAVLDEGMPAVARELRDYAARLERHHRDLCDIEFTIEHGRLWMLQCRIGKRTPRAALRVARDMADDPGFPLTREEAVRRVAAILSDPPTQVTRRRTDAHVLASGLPASPGIATGEVVISPEDAVRVAGEGRSVILVRAETSPDDVHGMARAAGILTSTGGFVSHAAVVARGWNIPAVVGAASVVVEDESILAGGTRIRVGTTISIDGGTGEVFEGEIGGVTAVVPEAAILVAWAEELGIEIPAKAEPPEVDAVAAGDAPATAGSGTTGLAAVGPDDVLRAMLVKGYVLPDDLGAALVARPDEVGALLDRLAADGLAEISAGSFRLSADGKAVAAELVVRDSDTWGIAEANAALDAFLALDHRMKETVTAWQMREVDGVQAFNDHSDAAYDAHVLARLGTLHDDARAWLAPCIAGLPRLATYLHRLDLAARLAAEGDGTYVASPRVDSYHGVWFELHEDLILLAGRSREDEVAAGRA
jgi:pyruvate, orthophosphate dikinase